MVDNTDNLIDSRDVIERFDELCTIDRFVITAEEEAERAALAKLIDQGETFADWHHGLLMVRDDWFTEYTKELVCETVEGMSGIPEWVAIDWEATADAVRVDYTDLEFDGVTYWAR